MREKVLLNVEIGEIERGGTLGYLNRRDRGGRDT